MSAKGIWIAFGVGVSAGAAVALLYAPESGIKTRKRLRRGIDDGVDYLEDAAEYLKKQADILSSQAKSAIEDTRGQASHIVDKAADLVNGAARSVQSHI